MQQDSKWTSPPDTPRNYMSLQNNYPYGSEYPPHPASNPTVLPGMSTQSTTGLMSSSQPNTPRPDIISPPPDKLTAAPDLIRRRPPLPSRPASFTTTTFHSNPYPIGNPSLRRRRTETSMFSFETGPSFSQTKQELELWNIDQSNGYQVQIHAKMDRGFFRADQDWTCYRRNYFQVSATFDVHGTNYMLQGPEVPCLLRAENQEIHQVDFFSIGVSAHVSGSDKKIELVQHTPKRDKGPQMIPEPRVVSAGGNLHLASVGSNHNIVTFERMQFKTATANNGKRRAAQQYYEIVIELCANTSSNKQFKVAQCVSAPLVVRGRSPGHYADSHTRYRSMDAGIPSLAASGFPVGGGQGASTGGTSSPVVAHPPTEERYMQPRYSLGGPPPSSEYPNPYSSYPQPQGGGYPYPVGYNSVMNTPPSHPPLGGGPPPPMTSRSEEEAGPHRNSYMMHPYSSHPMPPPPPPPPSQNGPEPYYNHPPGHPSQPMDHGAPHPNSEVYNGQESKPYWSESNSCKEQNGPLQPDERYSNSSHPATNGPSYPQYGYMRSQNDNSNPNPPLSTLDASSLDAGRSMTPDSKHYMQHHSSN